MAPLLRAWRGLALLAALWLAGGAQAHEMTLAEMSLREVASGQFVWSWGAPGKNKPVAEDLTPVWPAGCVGDAQTVRCGPDGLVGAFEVQGVGKAYSAAIVRIRWRNGEPQVLTLTSAQPRAQLFGGATDARGGAEVAATYGLLGVEHILTGLDHLLFVIGLLMLVGFRRRLVGTITAFTLAHSLTLAASALGWLVLRPPPVEATIALSIVLVSLEALRERDTLARRWPALVAFLFGLVHGLGFAGALKEIGLPSQHAFVALLTFNLGVEVGQLGVVGLAWALGWAAQRWLDRWLPTATARRALLYAIGSIASYWSIARLAALAG